jgi:adenosylcobinamide-phosphate synthase
MMPLTNLICAFFLDLAIGDPNRLPHPVRIMGKYIDRMENFLRGHSSVNNGKKAGILLVISIVIPAIVITAFIQEALHWPSEGVFRIVGAIILVYLTATTLALHELITAAGLVIEAVRVGNMADARKNLSMIVGRDTHNLSEEKTLRATIETVAENLSDGFVAPLFYLVIGGLPLAMGYKAINTLDSMVGYRNERYIHFGWAAAKLDDAANYIPARMTGLLIVIAAFCYSLFKDPRTAASIARRAYFIMRRDGRNHSSPNSGVPEAAMAGALGVRLGGPSTYNGVLIVKSWIGDEAAAAYLIAADRTVVLATIGASVAVAIAVCILGMGALL